MRVVRSRILDKVTEFIIILDLSSQQLRLAIRREHRTRTLIALYDMPYIAQVWSYCLLSVISPRISDPRSVCSLCLCGWQI